MCCSVLRPVAPSRRRDTSVRRRRPRPSAVARRLLFIAGCLVASLASLPALAEAAPRERTQAAETTTTVAATAPELVHGQPIQLTATVTATLGPPATPTGTVAFLVDGGAVGEQALADDGTAAIEVPTLTAGDHVVRAEYAPTGDFQASAGETSVTIGKAESVTSLNVAPATSVAGQVIELSASVRSQTAGAGAPTGTVEFSEPGVGRIDSPQSLSADGTARMSVVGPAGRHTIQAAYSGDANFTASRIEVAHETRRADTVTRITSSPNPNAPGGTIEVTILVDVVRPGDVPPFGTVQLDVNGDPLGDAIALEGGDGVRVTLESSGGPRTDTIGVAYSGDANTNPSSASLRQTVADEDGAAPPGPSDPSAPSAPSVSISPTAPITPIAPAGPAPRTGPLAAATVAVADLNEMTAALLPALRRRGVAALRSIVQRLRAPVPGVLSQRVFLTSATRKRGRAARVVVALGRRRFETAGAAALRLRLTAAGRRHARRRTRGSVELVTRFTPAGGTPVVSTRRVAIGGRRRSRPPPARQPSRSRTILAPSTKARSLA